jgi:hypothetical protein
MEANATPKQINPTKHRKTQKITPTLLSRSRLLKSVSKRCAKPNKKE